MKKDNFNCRFSGSSDVGEKPTQAPQGTRIFSTSTTFSFKLRNLSSQGGIHRVTLSSTRQGWLLIDSLRRKGSVLTKNSFQIIMASVLNFNMELHQMYVKSIFLNGILEKEVYMK